jgi:chondroitin-sulfate-ABC endolyase/exolyase
MNKRLATAISASLGVFPIVPHPSRIIIKELELKGKWHVSAYDKRVKTTYRTGTTQLSVECQHGQPVEFTLVQ